MCNILFGIYLICQGALAYTPVLDEVANRRYNANWSLPENPLEFDALIGVQYCYLVGKQGFLITGGKRFRILISDCQSRADRAMNPMIERGLLADINLSELNHQKAYLILKK